MKLVVQMVGWKAERKEVKTVDSTVVVMAEWKVCSTVEPRVEWKVALTVARSAACSAE